MGGFNPTGLAWRYTLPTKLIGKMPINLLEFIAAAITIYLTIVAAMISQKLLPYTDSSSAFGWLYKASFNINKPVHDKLEKWLAKFIIENDTVL